MTFMMPARTVGAGDSLIDVSDEQLDQRISAIDLAPRAVELEEGRENVGRVPAGGGDEVDRRALGDLRNERNVATESRDGEVDHCADAEPMQLGEPLHGRLNGRVGSHSPSGRFISSSGLRTKMCSWNSVGPRASGEVWPRYVCDARTRGAYPLASVTRRSSRQAPSGQARANGVRRCPQRLGERGDVSRRAR